MPATAISSPVVHRSKSDLGVATLFLLPSFLGLSAFLIFPLTASLWLSFTNWQVIGQARFVGFANYINLATNDPIFWQVLRNTLFYTAEYLALNIVLSLAMAVWINSLSWGKTLFRLVFFLPTFTPLVGVSLVWLLILTPGGIMDWTFHALNLSMPNLIINPNFAMQALVLVSLWSHFGYNMLLFGAALESVPKNYLEAAEIDGATAWQRFWRIKLPLISPSLFFGTVLTAITSMQTFDQVYALTHGGPGSATTTLGYAIYTQGFVTYKFGYASSIAWVLFAIIMLLTALQLHLQKRWVNYDA
ncbi:sugar ABC transporter permease [Terrarubrum flagellatum]|uniref:carbohydrate ABC transporter permease n=1 Tax=Terrirubrum flagellatum TaxID=2895980 RepID=UPI0031454112